MPERVVRPIPAPGLIGALRRCVLTLGTVAVGALPAAAQPAPKRPPAPGASYPAMSFTPGRLPETRPCGAACVEFIVADGEIGFGSALAYLLARKKTGDRDIPVILNSPGGYVAGATNLGRMWRKLGVTVIVASAEPRPCGAPAAPCDAADQQAGVIAFSVTSEKSECASACPFALAGAKTRIVPPAAGVGVHETYVDTEDGVGRALEGLLSAEQKALAQKETERELADFAREMGIDPEIASRSMKTKHSTMDWLSAGDVRRYRLSTADLASLPAPLAASLSQAAAREPAKSPVAGSVKSGSPEYAKRPGR